MVVVTMAQIRTDLAARAAVDTTLNTYPTIPETVESPAFYVGLQQGISYESSYGPTGAVITFACVLVVSAVDADEAVTLLDLYVDPTRGSKAMKVLLEDQSVSNTGSIAWIVVKSSSEPGTVSFDNTEYLAVEFLAEVHL